MFSGQLQNVSGHYKTLTSWIWENGQPEKIIIIIIRYYTIKRKLGWFNVPCSKNVPTQNWMISVIIMPACLPAYFSIHYHLCTSLFLVHLWELWPFFPNKNFCGILIASFFGGHQVAKFHPQKKESK